MALHQTLKHCTQCGHAAELHVEVCPKCKKVFDANPDPNTVVPQHEHSVTERTMNQVQVDAISKEKLEFNRRWKELSGKKDSSEK